MFEVKLGSDHSLCLEEGPAGLPPLRKQAPASSPVVDDALEEPATPGRNRDLESQHRAGGASLTNSGAELTATLYPLIA